MGQARLALVLSVIIVAALAVCCGCSDGGTTVIPVGWNGVPQVAAIPDQRATRDFPFSLDLSPYVTDDSGPVSSLTFLVVSGGGSFTGAVYENTFNATGPVTVEFLVLDTAGALTQGSFNVDVLSPPVADFTADVTNGTATLSVSFTDQSTGDIDTWAWDFGDTGTSAEQDPTHDYTAPGWYDVSLTVTGPGGSHTRTKYAFIQVLGGASNIWYVDAACVSATHDGYDWATAFNDIYSGVQAATDGDMVLVADGTYIGTSNTDLDFGGRLICVASRDLYGSGACVIDCQAAGSAFLFSSGETKEAVIDGFTMMNGSNMGGAGIACFNGSSPTIVNCIITGCSAGDGGAIYASDSSQPTIGNCVLTGNTASSNGGAVFLGSDAGATIAHCTITGNHTNTQGGGIYGADSLGITIYDCIIEDNAADHEGGGIAASYCPATMTNTSLSGNFSGVSGGGLYFFHSTITMTDCRVDGNRAAANGGGICGDDSVTSLYMTNCTVDDNNASGWGGGICLYEVTVSLTDCSVSRNGSVASEANGGGMYAWFSEITLTSCTLADNLLVSIDDPCGGGALNTIGTNATLEGCSIYGNSAESHHSMVQGGGMYLMAMGEVSASVTDCSVTNNTATGIDVVRGGGINLLGVPAQVTGSTISDNTAYELGTADVGMVYGGGIYVSPEDITLSNCTISGNVAEGYAPNGNEEGYGGGICSESSNTTISGCTISDNTVRAQGDGAYGGGLYTDSCSLTMNNCQVAGNSSITPTGNQATRGGGGGIYMAQSTAELTGCAISLNFSDYHGGAIRSDYTDATLTCCTISDNNATDSGGGAHLDGDSASCTARNSIFWGNSAGVGNEIYTGTAFDLLFINSDYSSTTGDIEGTGTVSDGGGNIHTDPLFVTGPRGNYYLNSDADAGTDSPCIDAGSGVPADYGLQAKTTRTDGTVDTGTVDIGYHYDP
jgi:parallel beta-helix repeat protein